MKKIYLLILSSFITYNTALSQNLILNGSFENNTATTNTIDLTSNWAATVSNSFPIDGGSMDLITSNTCGNPSNGSWFVTCSPQGGTWPYMAFSFKLSTTLTFGAQYTLTFDKRYCGPNSSPIDIGVSTDSSLTGTPIHTFAAPLNNSWFTETYVFQSPLAAKYLTVNVGATGSTGTVGLDNFSLQAGVVGINELLTNTTNLFPNPSNGLFNVMLQSPNAIIDIYNAISQKVYSSTINSPQAIDLTGNPKGIYFYRINNHQAIIKQGKLTIQ